MIQELAWLIESGRYSGIAEHIEQALRDYSEQSKTGTEEQATDAREKARVLCELHSMESGFLNDDSYINIDAEFMNGTTVDEKAVDAFIKEIIKAYGYQRVLWSYMGTTPTLTEISRAAMETEGLSLRSYLPAKWKKNHPEKKPVLQNDNEALIYSYSDGTHSADYDRTKAKFRLDALKDSSGFNWNKGYDPNDSIRKDSWYGTYDEDGYWVRRDTSESGLSQGERESVLENMFLIRDGDKTLLHDPGSLCLYPAEIYYFTESGEPYGALESDIESTIKRIERILQDEGIGHIDGISGPRQSDAAESIVEQYKTILGPLASPDFAYYDAESIKETEARIRNRERAIQREQVILSAERTAAIAAATISKAEPLNRESLPEILKTGTARIAVSTLKTEDRIPLGLSVEEFEQISQTFPEMKEGDALDNTLVQVFTSWNSWKSAGFTKISFAKKIASALAGQSTSNDTIDIETTFRKIATGEYSAPDAFEDAITPMNPGEMEKTGRLTKQQAETAETVLRMIPPASSPEQDKKNKQAIARVLHSYPAIAQSTGMTIPEAILEAVRLSGGTVPPSPPKTGYVSPLAVTPPGDRRIFFEYTPEIIAETSAKTAPVLKTVELDLLNPTNEKDILVIGGENGKSLPEYGFNAAWLEKSRHFSKMEAKKTESIFSEWKIPEDSVNDAKTILKPILTAHLKPNKGSKNTAEKYITRLLEKLDARTDVRYNCETNSGKKAITRSNRYRAIPEIAQIILDQTDETSTPDSRTHSRIPVEPVLKANPAVRPQNRANPKGIPETTKRTIIRPGMPAPAYLQNPATIKSHTPEHLTWFAAAGIALGTDILHASDYPLPLLIFGDIENTNATPLATFSHITEQTLITQGYTKREAERTHTFLKHIHISKGQEQQATEHIIPILTEIASSTTTAKTFKERLVTALEHRTDIAFNLSNQTGKTAWKTGTAWLLSGLDDDALDKRIKESAEPLIARALNDQHEPAEPAEPDTAKRTIILERAKTALNAGNTPHQALIYVGGSGNEQGIPLAALMETSIDTLERIWGFTEREAHKTAALLNDIVITQNENPTGTASSGRTDALAELPKLIRDILKESESAETVTEKLISLLEQRTDVAYNLTSKTGRASYAATGRFKDSGLNAEELTRLIKAAERKALERQTTGVADPVEMQQTTQFQTAQSPAVLHSSSAAGHAAAITPADPIAALSQRTEHNTYSQHARTATPPIVFATRYTDALAPLHKSGRIGFSNRETLTGNATHQNIRLATVSSVSGSGTGSGIAAGSGNPTPKVTVRTRNANTTTLAGLASETTQAATIAFTSDIQNTQQEARGEPLTTQRNVATRKSFKDASGRDEHTTGAVSANREIGIPEASSNGTQGIVSGSTRTPVSKTVTEEERMKRIQANYQRDKAKLAKEATPALARKNTHDVGHAEGSEDEMNLHKIADRLSKEVREELLSKKR